MGSSLWLWDAAFRAMARHGVSFGCVTIACSKGSRIGIGNHERVMRAEREVPMDGAGNGKENK